MTDQASPDIPNPGSEEARAAGCWCAILDNNHGKFAPDPDGSWWITQGCPVHAPEVPDPIADALVGVDKTLGQTFLGQP
jgi:hypothetical protein